ncbi:MAG: SAM hydroxide adenosyltransferase, partial [Alphaproteobacteria bacterium]
LFAPAAARIACGERPGGDPRDGAARPGGDWPDDLARIVYIDRFGNAMTGLRAAALPADAGLEVAGRVLARARTFAEVPPGAPFWYENSSGLAEIAVNRGRAADALGLSPGVAVAVRET